MGSGIIELDLHGLRAEEAQKKIDQAIKTASQSVYRIKLIHGYHRGHGIRDMIREEYSHGLNPRVLRVESG